MNCGSSSGCERSLACLRAAPIRSGRPKVSRRLPDPARIRRHQRGPLHDRQSQDCHLCRWCHARDMVAARDAGLVRGFTTNPTLMRKVGITDYAAFARKCSRPLEACRSPSRSSPTSSRRWNARRSRLPGLGLNVSSRSRSPTRGESSLPAWSGRLSSAGSSERHRHSALEQVRESRRRSPAEPGIVSVFAGRIADTAADPALDARSVANLRTRSPRQSCSGQAPGTAEYPQADELGCDIITVTSDSSRSSRRWWASLWMSSRSTR